MTIILEEDAFRDVSSPVKRGPRIITEEDALVQAPQMISEEAALLPPPALTPEAPVTQPITPGSPDIPTFGSAALQQAFSVALHQPVVDVGINMAATIGATAVAAMAGAINTYENIYFPEASEEDKHTFVEVFEGVSELLTPPMMTAEGKAFMEEKVAPAVKWLANKRKEAGNAVFEATGSPELAVGTELALAGTVMLAPFARGRGRAGKPDDIPTLDQAVRVNELRPADINPLAQRMGEVLRDSIPDLPSRVVRAPKTGEIMGADIRTFREMKDSLFEGRATTAKSGKAKMVKVPVVRDIHPLRQDFSARLAPGKFVADLHPALKWAVDKIEGVARQVEVRVETILFAPEFVAKGGFGTIRRQTTPIATNRGARAPFDSLPLKGQMKVKEAALEWSRAGVEPTSSTMAAKGLNISEMFAYQALRRGLQEVRADVNNTGKLSGASDGALLADKPGYMPHVWVGNFRIFAVNTQGKPVKTLSATTRIGAKRRVEQLRKEFPDHRISFSPVKRGSGDLSLQAFRDATRVLEKGSNAAKALEEAYLRILGKRGFRVHGKQRQDVEGFMGSAPGRRGVQDFKKAYEAYVEGGTRFAGNMRMTRDIDQFLRDGDIARAWPNVSVVVERFRNNSLGKRSAIDRAIADWTREAIGEGAPAATINIMNRITLVAKLANPRFLMANAIQPYLLIPSELARIKGTGVKASVNKALAQAQWDFIFARKGSEAVDATRFAFKEKTIDPKFVRETIGEERLAFSDPLGVPRKAFDTVTGLRIMGRFEEYARIQANLMFFRFLRNAGTPKGEAMRISAYMTDKYMVEYTSTTRPTIYGPAFIGTLAKPIGLFKTFQHQYIAAMVEHAKAAGRGRPGGLVVATGSMILQGGLLGIMGVVQIDFLLNALGLPTMTRTLMRLGIPDWLLWGAPSAALDFDLTTTTAAPGLAPTDFFSFPALEYLGKAAYSGVAWGIKKAQEAAGTGRVTPADELEFWERIAPTAMKGFIEKWYAQDELVIASKRGGVGVFRRGNREWIRRYFAGRTLEEARALKGMWQMTIIERAAKDDLETLLTVGAWAIFNGIDDNFSWAIDKAVTEHNMRPRDFQRAARNRAEKLSETMLEQWTQFEKGRKGRERADAAREIRILEEAE